MNFDFLFFFNCVDYSDFFIVSSDIFAVPASLPPASGPPYECVWCFGKMTDKDTCGLFVFAS